MFPFPFPNGGGFSVAVNRPFERQFSCYSLVMFGGQQHRESLEYGGKVLLPPSALHELAQLNIVYPMVFKITNSSNGLATHCGVLEFTAEEGRAYLPGWLMAQLGLGEGQRAALKSVSLPLGRFIKIQPQELEFLDLSNPKAVLEHSLPQFTCMSVGDVVAISYLGRPYRFKVLETKPGTAISVIETDIEVDFAPPPGYVEPSAAKAAAPVPVPASVAAKSGTAADGSPAAASASATLEREDSSKGFVAFSGQGQSIRGRASPSAPATVPLPRSTSGAVVAGSLPNGTSPRSVGMPSFSPTTVVPPLAMAKGKLSFDFSAPTSAPTTATAGTSGRSTPAAAPAASAAPAKKTTGFTPFSGQGNSLK